MPGKAITISPSGELKRMRRREKYLKNELRKLPSGRAFREERQELEKRLKKTQAKLARLDYITMKLVNKQPITRAELRRANHEKLNTFKTESVKSL